MNERIGDMPIVSFPFLSDLFQCVALTSNSLNWQKVEFYSRKVSSRKHRAVLYKNAKCFCSTTYYSIVDPRRNLSRTKVMCTLILDPGLKDWKRGVRTRTTRTKWDWCLKSLPRIEKCFPDCWGKQNLYFPSFQPSRKACLDSSDIWRIGRASRKEYR